MMWSTGGREPAEPLLAATLGLHAPSVAAYKPQAASWLCGFRRGDAYPTATCAPSFDLPLRADRRELLHLHLKRIAGNRSNLCRFLPEFLRLGC